MGRGMQDGDEAARLHGAITHVSAAGCRGRPGQPVARRAGVEDHADQLDEGHAVLRGKDGQVGMMRVEPGERVGLEEIGLALAHRSGSRCAPRPGTRSAW